MSRDNCENSQCDGIHRESISMDSILQSLPRWFNFVEIAPKYIYPDAFRYFLLSFNNFSRSNLSVQLINFCTIRIALTEFLHALVKFAVKMERARACIRFSQRGTIENGIAQFFFLFIEIIVMRNSLQTSRRGFHSVLFHIELERWLRLSNTVSL